MRTKSFPENKKETRHSESPMMPMQIYKIFPENPN